MNAWVNLGTFIVCRFCSILAIIIGMIIWGDRVSTIYMVCLTASMTVMTPINIILFQRLLKNDVYRFHKNTYHNKYRTSLAAPSETTKTKPHSNGVTSNNNSAKHFENGHVGHSNGVANGVLNSEDLNGKKSM